MKNSEFKIKFVRLLTARLKELVSLNLRARDEGTKRLILHSFQINRELYENITGKKVEVKHERV